MRMEPAGRGQILPFPIDFGRRLYNIFTTLLHYCASAWYIEVN